MVLLSIYQIPIVLLDHWGEEVIGYEYFVLNVFLRNAGILGLLTEKFTLHRAVILKWVMNLE